MIAEHRSKLLCSILELEEKQFCSKCHIEYFDKAKLRSAKMRPIIVGEIASALSVMPSASISNPPGWVFKILGIVTGQATMGTGMVTEFISDFTDIFGAQSKRHSAKLKQGEELCFSQIKMGCHEKGGNALVGIDIDYAEVGGVKSMLMVCMTATAVRLENIDSQYPEQAKTLQSIPDFEKKLSLLDSFDKEFQFQ